MLCWLQVWFEKIWALAARAPVLISFGLEAAMSRPQQTRATLIAPRLLDNHPVATPVKNIPASGGVCVRFRSASLLEFHRILSHISSVTLDDIPMTDLDVVRSFLSSRHLYADIRPAIWLA